MVILSHHSFAVRTTSGNVAITGSMWHFVVCPAEGHERSRRSAGNTKKRKTCSQQKVTRIKRFWSKHFRQRNKTIFTEYDRKKIKAFFCKYYFVSLPKSVYITSVLRSCLSAGYKLSESLCALGMTRARSRPSAGHTMTYWKVVYIFFQVYNKFAK